MKNYLIIALLLLSFGFPQKMLNKKVMIEEKLSNNDEIIVYPPNSVVWRRCPIKPSNL